MADKWMDERDRQMRDRDWRRSEQYGRGGRPDEGRSFGADPSGYRGQDRVFGERETGSNYSRGTGVTPGGGAYGAGGSYGGGQSYGRGAGAQPGGSQGGGFSGGGEDRPAWQDRDYGGASPAFESQDYTQGGRESRGGGYERGAGQYGSDVRTYGPAPRPYDAQRQGSSAHGRPYGQSGGTGGYDYERGYGDAGRRDDHGDRTERFEDAGRSAGQFLHRAGEKMASWFSGNDQTDDRRYREDFGRERREMGHRGLGPKGYKRPDERINEEAHDRLTDDPWLDASNINISVSGGEVTLSGTVENREAKHRAERLVEDLAGVNHVQNNLRIAKGSFLTSPTSGFGDSAVEAQMRQDDPVSNGTGGSGAGESTAGRKS